MYRLLNSRLTSMRKIPTISFSVNGENVNSEVTDKLWALNKNLTNYCKSCARFQSTQTSPLKLKKGRRRAKSKKNYFDLLVVTDSSAKQQKTTIQKLTWDDLKLLASTNLDLSQLHKLKDAPEREFMPLEHTYNNLNLIDNVPTITLPQSPQPELVPQVEDCDLDDPIPLVKCALQPEVMEEPDHVVENNALKTGVSKANKRDSKERYQIAMKTLAAYLEVCSILRNPQRGLNALVFHNQRAARVRDKSLFMPVKNIEVYNALLKGFASRGDIGQLEEVVRMIRTDGVDMNLQSYITILEGYGRVNVDGHYLKQIRIYAKEASQKNYSPNRLLNEGTFLNDEREVVLKALQDADLTFEPQWEPPRVQYQNHLVDHLNCEQQLEFKAPTKSNRLIFEPERLKSLILEQLDLEKNGFVAVKSIENHGSSVTEDVVKYRKVLAEHFKHWEETALEAFNRDLAALTAQRSPLNYEPYMRCIPSRDFVRIIVDEARKIAEGSETYSPTVGQLYKELGGKVYARYQVLRKQKSGVLDKVLKIHTQYCEHYAHQHETLDVHPAPPPPLNPRQQWQWIEHALKPEGATLAMDHREWNPSTFQQIGKFLYRIVMHDLKIDVNAMRANSKHRNLLPAFYTIFRTQGRQVKEEVKPHPVLSKLHRASMSEILTFPAYELPMRCPPVPWTGVDNGGYLVAPCDVVRLPPQATSQKHRLGDAQSEQLYPCLDALNQLAAVPWKVNNDILDVILEVFNKGGSSHLDVPEPPSALPPPPSITVDMDKTQKFKIFRQKLQHRRKKAEMYSLWCDCLYRLSLANHFRDDTFWLPHNMDFRGRVYPVPPHLNHLGSDMARSMLVFAEARPLGPEGLDWLKIHLINLTGLKKRDSVRDRLHYADSIMDLILDSADRPLNGKKWWTESEEPWQTLACCMEIAKASRSDDPTEFRSHFPVHQDGSCNGLQHYAALGRDSAGAFSVNLCPSETPQDVYSAVVSLVEDQRSRDAENGVEVAKLLDGFVKRKVIKQTIMTTVYGVTRFGARLQIARQLKDIDSFPKESVWSASAYLTSRTFESLRTMFTSTREIQDWFTDCARLISAVSGQYVEWVTPMGLPIVQPYFRPRPLVNSTVYKPFYMDHFEKPNVMKQKNAFPPNFIHSLDSSHMMLTSLHCEREGLTFVSVHDCYWTHPSTVHTMNKICREQFVRLHSEPILENLSQFFTEKYGYDLDDFADDGSASDISKKKLNRVLRQLPKTGDFDIEQVLHSIYFFS